MDPRLAIAMAALATSSRTLGAEAARSQKVITRQYAMASLAAIPAPPSGFAYVVNSGGAFLVDGAGAFLVTPV